MELSKEQIELLKLAEKNEIPFDVDYYYSNEILQDLIFKAKLIETESGYDNPSHDLLPYSYKLTVEGKNELSKALEKKHKRWNDKLLFPVINSVISAVIGAIIGAIATYLNMK